MAFYDQWSRKISAKGQEAVQKTKEMAELNRISSELGSLEQKILELIRTTEIPEDIGDMCVSNFLKLKGINYHTFKKYIDIHADDPEVIAFMSRFNARYKRRIAVIIKYLKETGLMIKDIAKELNETESRISRINRRYNIRPAKTKKYTPGEYEPE